MGVIQTPSGLSQWITAQLKYSARVSIVKFIKSIGSIQCVSTAFVALPSVKLRRRG